MAENKPEPGGSKPNKITAKMRWAKLANVVDLPPQAETDQVPISHSEQADETENQHAKPEVHVAKVASRVVVQSEAEKQNQIKQGGTFKMMKFISNLNRMVNKQQREPELKVVDDVKITVKSKRRFLFDDEASRVGAKNVFSKGEEIPEEDFNDVVDQDDHRIEVFVSQELVGKLLDSTYFKFFIFALIVINSLLIGLQTDYNMSVRYRYLFSIFDHAVLSVFICEILLKWYHGFWIFWQVGWNILDFVIIVALLLGPQLAFLSSSRILRILRVLRAFRSLRSISALSGLSMVVQTILQSIPDMANICLLLTIILLMLGVAGVTLFGRNIPDRFGDLQTAMFSLFICVTQDGWVNIYKKFQMQSGWIYIGGSIYFIIAIVIGSFVFANLVVAVVVTNLELAMKEMKQEKHAMVDTLAVDVKEDTNDPKDDNAHSVPIITFNDVQKGVDFTDQSGIELGDMRGLTTDRIEKYFTVLSALEDNLAEYIHIKTDLLQMYELIKDLNVTEQMDSDYAFEGWKRPVAPNFDLKELKKGDILSNLMKLEENSLLASDNAGNIDDLVRNTRIALHSQQANRSMMRMDIRRQREGGSGSSYSIK